MNRAPYVVVTITFDKNGGKEVEVTQVPSGIAAQIAKKEEE